MRNKFVFDLDGTITVEETLPLIGSRFRINDELASMTRAAMEGRVPFQESFITRVSLLSKLPVSAISSLLADVTLHPELAAWRQGPCTLFE